MKKIDNTHSKYCHKLPSQYGRLRLIESRNSKRKHQLARRRVVFSFLSSLILTVVILLSGIQLFNMIAGSQGAMQKWDVQFINVATTEIESDSSSYFGQPVANIVALSPRNDKRSLLRFYANSEVKTFLPREVNKDSFAMLASTQIRLKADEIYIWENHSNGWVEIEIINTETAESNPYLIWDGGKKRDRFITPEKKVFFEVQDSGVYDINVYYFNNKNDSLPIIDIDLENPPIPDSYEQLYQYYGNPLDPDFVTNYITIVGLKNPNGGEWEVECHKAIVQRLRQVWEDLISSDKLHLIQTYNGCLNIRMKRGKNEPSVHSWGLAIDINAKQYPMGSVEQQPEAITNAFKKQGFSWGGHWKSRKDPMHYEFSVAGI